MGIILSPDQFILVTLLVKIGVMASLASILIRLRSFKRILLVEEKTPHQKWAFAGLFAGLITVGVGCRILLNFSAADLSLEGTLLVALLTGPVPGLTVGLWVGMIAAVKGELLALPMGFLYGLVGGLISAAQPRKDEIWKFSPFSFMNLYQFLKIGWLTRIWDWKIILFLVCILLEIFRVFVSRRFGQALLFSLNPQSMVVLLCMFGSTLLSLVIPLKIWNTIRIEMLLERQELLTNRMRFEALRNQINPHFLFNTLNSISVSIRTNPDRARNIILKLSKILRRLLSTDEDFVTLREELELIDAYLDIEAVRFGEHNLKVHYQIDQSTLDMMVPSMILQPLVENAIRHGLYPKIGGGNLWIRSTRNNGLITLQIEDDGRGMSHQTKIHAMEKGIGLSNVNERLGVIFGNGYRLELESQPNKRTCVTLKFPVMPPSYHLGTAIKNKSQAMQPPEVPVP